jgi:mono/diheme cytochrome c family protein
MKAIFKLALAAGAAGLAACTVGPDSPRGFSLPKGDPEVGKETFVALRCNDCHSAKGVDMRDPEASDIQFPLGGRSTRVTTYASLVTSIINPSHKLSSRYPRSRSSDSGESRMPIYNDVMTVQELIDVVAYLHPQYELIVVSPSAYETYYP